MYNTFNMGLGMVIALDPEDVDTAMEAIQKAGDTCYVVGNIVEGQKELNYVKTCRTDFWRRYGSSIHH